MIKVTRSAIIDAPIEQVWTILRDFNSHWAWHPAVGDSRIENGERADQVGCVRNFFLKDGAHIREQLLTLSDRDFISTYCILDATVPLKRYVATLQLKRVTDGNRTFWHWQSTFETPPGQEAELAAMVGNGVYEGGFEGLRAFLRRRRGDMTPLPPEPPAPIPRATGAADAGGSTVSGDATRASGTAAAAGGATAGRPSIGVATAVVVERFGGPENLRLKNLPVPAPGPGEATIRQTAIGVNYIDVYVRKGLYRLIDPPAPPGMEAAGVVEAVGPGVAHLLPGDRVAYACPPVGAYTSLRTMPAESLVPLPDDVDDQTAAALMLKGMSAEYLLHRTHRLRAGQTVLVHAAAGGLGQLVCAWARALGATVIGTVSSEEKARIARAHGCESTIVTRDYRFADTVAALTDGRGVDLVIDGLGREAAAQNLESLATCGHWISVGQASGPLDPIDPQTLEAKSLSFSRPVLFHYTQQRRQLLEMAANTFEAWRRGTLRIDGPTRYPLAAADEAHRALESRGSHGPIVLLP